MIAHAQGQVPLNIRKARLGSNYLANFLLPALLFAVISQSGCSANVGGSSAVAGLNASASSLSFGNVKVGATSTLAVTFTNTSNSNLTVSSVTIAGPGFAVSGISNGLNLTPGTSVAVTVSFAPSATGPVTGSITVAHTASNPTITIPLSGTGVIGHTATLSWNPSSSSNVVGYYIYRGIITGGPYSKMNSTSPNQGTTAVDGAVQSRQTYYYVVTAVDVNGLESSFSNEVLASIP